MSAASAREENNRAWKYRQNQWKEEKQVLEARLEKADKIQNDLEERLETADQTREDLEARLETADEIQKDLEARLEVADETRKDLEITDLSSRMLLAPMERNVELLKALTKICLSMVTAVKSRPEVFYMLDCLDWEIAESKLEDFMLANGEAMGDLFPEGLESFRLPQNEDLYD